MSVTPRWLAFSFWAGGLAAALYTNGTMVDTKHYVIPADDIDRQRAATLIKASRAVMALSPPVSGKNKRTAHDDYVRLQKEGKLRRAIIAYTNGRLMDSDGKQKLVFEHKGAHYTMVGNSEHTFIRRRWNMRGRERGSGRDVKMTLSLEFTQHSARQLAKRVLNPWRSLVVLKPALLVSDEELRQHRFTPQRELLDEFVTIQPALRALWHPESPWYPLPNEVKYHIMYMLLGHEPLSRRRPPQGRVIQFPEPVAV